MKDKPIDIKKLSVDQIKVMLYDQIMIQNTATQNIQVLQSELASREKNGTVSNGDEQH